MGLLFASVLWTIAWWLLAWNKVPLVSEYSFFPLWLGYIFTLNAASETLHHDSLLRRMRGWFLFLFLVSIPLSQRSSPLSSLRRSCSSATLRHGESASLVP